MATFNRLALSHANKSHTTSCLIFILSCCNCSNALSALNDLMCMRGRLCIMYLPKHNVTDFPNLHLGYSSSWLDTFCVIVMLINSYFSGQRSDIHAVTHLKFVHIRNKEKCCRNLFSRFNLGTKWLRATLTGESQFLSFLWTLHAPLKCWVTFPLGCSVPFQYQKICMFSACDKN